MNTDGSASKILTVGLLAASLLASWWLFASTFYFPPQWLPTVLIPLAAVGALTFAVGSDRNAVPANRRKTVVTPRDNSADVCPPSPALLPATLFAVATFLLPWPTRLPPALLAGGFFLLWATGGTWRLMNRLARAVQLAGTILLAQAFLFGIYLYQTMHGRDLPTLWAAALGGVLRSAGIEAGHTGRVISLAGSGSPALVVATWELVFDPVTLNLWIGGLVFLLAFVRQAAPQVYCGSDEEEHRSTAHWLPLYRRLSLAFSAWILLWLVIRLKLLLGLHLHRLGITPEAIPEAAGDVFISPTLHLLFALVAAGLAGTLLGKIVPRELLQEVSTADRGVLPRKERFPHSQERETPEEAGPSTSSPLDVSPLAKATSVMVQPAKGEHALCWKAQGVALACTCVGAALLGFTWVWDPPGKPLQGRVVVVERHSTWEPTDQRYDTEHFGHDPSYSYSLLFQYCQQYFEMSRLTQEERITPARLANCDVLIVKIPTERWERQEIEAVVEFVRRGGGLLLIGDHTNVFNSSTYLNDICRQFGFMFAHDLLFWMPNAYYQPWEPTYPAHPAVGRVPPMHFAVGCSVDPGRSRGRAAIWSTGLWSLPCEFHAPNYHPVPQWRSDMRYGAFIQLWATRFGRGRILAFTDSTIFSNFCLFQPGKAELFREMLWWLMRRGIYDYPLVRWVLPSALFLVALGLLGVALALACRKNVSGWILLGGGLAALAMGIFVADGSNRIQNSTPPVLWPAKWLVVDRTTSSVPLALGAFNEDRQGNGYGLLEQALSRIGYFTTRKQGLKAIGGEGVVIICPTNSAPHDFREALIRYVESGGRLLVLDSPASVGTTANSLLWPFGIEMLHATGRGGKIRLADRGPELEIDEACEVKGGTPFAWIEDLPVAALTHYGKGIVVAIGFATLWNDRHLGDHWMIAEEPKVFRREDLEPEVRDRYDLLFAVLKMWLEDTPVSRPPLPPLKPRDSEKSG